jgi:hypothetical protein
VLVRGWQRKSHQSNRVSNNVRPQRLVDMYNVIRFALKCMVVFMEMLLRARCTGSLQTCL